LGNRIVCTPKHTGPIKRSCLGSPRGRLSAGSSSARFDPNPASTAGFHLAVRSVASHGDHAPTLDVVQAAEQCVLLSTRRPQNAPGLQAAPHRGLRSSFFKAISTSAVSAAWNRCFGIIKVHRFRYVISAGVPDQGSVRGEAVTAGRTRVGLRLVLHHAVRARPLSDSWKSNPRPTSARTHLGPLSRRRDQIEQRNAQRTPPQACRPGGCHPLGASPAIGSRGIRLTSGNDHWATD
jgi:hypothetical protein